MKKILSIIGFSLAVVTSVSAQEFKMPDYVRGSIYSIRLDAPSSSKGNFAKEIKVMTSVFDTLDYEHVYRKYKGGKTKCGKGWMRLECGERLVYTGIERC